MKRWWSCRTADWFCWKCPEGKGAGGTWGPLSGPRLGVPGTPSNHGTFLHGILRWVDAYAGLPPSPFSLLPSRLNSTRLIRPFEPWARIVSRPASPSPLVSTSTTQPSAAHLEGSAPRSYRTGCPDDCWSPVSCTPPARARQCLKDRRSFPNSCCLSCAVDRPPTHDPLHQGPLQPTTRTLR